MADETQTAGAPTLPGPRAPVATTDAKPKRARRARSGNGGRRKQTPEEKAAAQAAREASAREREQADHARAETRRQMARIASIGALTPHLLDPQEVSALSRFALAMVQGAVPAEQGQG